MPKQDLDRHDHVILGLVMNIQATAMMQMGKIVDPAAGELRRDLDDARVSIDILEALRAKCRGNLPTDVAALLDRAVMNPQLNYTDEVERDAAAAAPSSEPETEETGGGADHDRSDDDRE